jgi:hypothetical protein
LAEEKQIVALKVSLEAVKKESFLLSKALKHKGSKKSKYGKAGKDRDKSKDKKEKNKSKDNP